MLTHGPRQAHVWLIFDVRQKMMHIITLLLLVMAVVSASASDIASAVFLSAHEAAPGDEITVTIETYNRSGAEARAPVIDELSLAYDQLFSADGSLMYSTSTLSPVRPTVLLAPKAYIRTEFTFSVPDLPGTLVVRLDGLECIPASLRVVGPPSKRHAKEVHGATLKDLSAAIQALPSAFRKKPNQPPEPTPTSVTPPAAQEARQP